MQELFTKRRLEEDQIALEEELGAPKPVYVTDAGWYYRVCGDQYARGGPAPDDQVAFPRMVELGLPVLALLERDYRDPSRDG